MPIKKSFLAVKILYRLAKIVLLLFAFLYVVGIYSQGYLNKDFIFQKNAYVLFQKYGLERLDLVFKRSFIILIKDNFISGLIMLSVYIGLLSHVSRKVRIFKYSEKSPEGVPYTSEANMVSILGMQATGIGAQDYFPLVFPVEDINIRVYQDPEVSLTDFKTFDFDHTSKTNPLLEKELFRPLQAILEARGLTHVKKNPQILISMDFYIGKKEQYTPPTTVTSTETQYVWNSGMIGWNVGGFTSAVPVMKSSTTPGYTTTTYYSNVRLNFLDRAKLVGKTKPKVPPMIWVGEADNEGLNSDIRGIAPMMFAELMGEFPRQTNKSPKRYVRHFIYSGLGLGFDVNDWSVIRYVAPSGVAAEEGIKPGDYLKSINNKPAGNWPAQKRWGSNDPVRYRSKDPYLQDILGNRGDKSVEIVIQSAETGKHVALRMKPRHEDRYFSINQ